MDGDMYTDLQVWLDHFDYHSSRRCVMPEGKRLGLRYEERLLIAGSAARVSALVDDRTRAADAGRDDSRGRRCECASAEDHRAADRREAAPHFLLDDFAHQHGLTTAHPLRRNRLLQSDPWEDFETQLATLATADLIGKVYLRALESATGCRQLRGLCRMLVADQLAHVGFESDVLRSLQASRPQMIRGARTLVFRAHFTAASLSAWIAHRPVLETAGYCVSTFIRACGAQYSFYLEPPMKTIASIVSPPLQSRRTNPVAEGGPS